MRKGRGAFDEWQRRRGAGDGEELPARELARLTWHHGFVLVEVAGDRAAASSCWKRVRSRRIPSIVCLRRSALPPPAISSGGYSKCIVAGGSAPYESSCRRNAGKSTIPSPSGTLRGSHFPSAR